MSTVGAEIITSYLEAARQVTWSACDREKDAERRLNLMGDLSEHLARAMARVELEIEELSHLALREEAAL